MAFLAARDTRPLGPTWRSAFTVKTVAEAAWMGQGERRSPLRAVRGCPGPHGGDSVEAGAVDERSVRIGPAGGADLHLLDGERVADDVLGQTLQVLALIWQDAAAAVHVESVETIGKGDRLQMIR